MAIEHNPVVEDAMWELGCDEIFEAFKTWKKSRQPSETTPDCPGQ